MIWMINEHDICRIDIRNKIFIIRHLQYSVINLQTYFTIKNYLKRMISPLASLCEKIISMELEIE